MARENARTSPPTSGWLWTVVQANLPAVLAGSLLLTLLVAGASYLFRPVYSTATVLTLDAELSRVLKGLNDGYPSLSGTDFIRPEYFATHSLNQMQVPAIASKIIASRKLQTRGGSALYEGDLVNPGLATLVFNNRGRGVTLKWIADTQQFSISGQSPDPEEAVALSTQYAELFLEQNAAQFRAVCAALVARFSDRVETLEKSLAAVNGEMAAVQNRHESVDVAEEAVQVSHRIEEIAQSLDAYRLAERTFATRLAETEKQAAQYQELIPYQRSIEANPRIASLKEELQQLVQEEAAAAIDYTAEHPKVASLLSQILTVRAALKEEAEKSFQGETQRMPSVTENIWQNLLDLQLEHLVYQYRVEHYTALRERYLQRQRELLAAERDLAPLSKKLDSLATLRTEALRELNTVQSLVDHTLPFFRVVSPATINHAALKKFRHFPKRKQLAVTTLIGAFFALGFLAIARELFRERLFRVGQLGEAAGAPAVIDGGALPPRTAATDESRYRFVRQACIVLRDEPLVCVESLTSGEDRQTAARVLAWSHAQAGRTVLLIDADGANRPLTRALGLDGRQAFQDVLARRVELERCLVRDALPGVAVLPAGNGPAAGRELAQLVEEAGRSWDRVIVLAPPHVEDAALADALPPHRRLLVAAWGRHGCDAVARFVGIAADPGAPPVLVLTQEPALPDLTTVRGLFALAVQTARATVSWMRPRRST